MTTSPAHQLVDRIATHLPDRYAIAAHVLAWARLTLRELLALTVGQTDPHGFGLLVDNDPNAQRFVDLPAPVADLLAEHIRRHTPCTPNALVVSHPSGHPLTPITARRLLARAGRAADLPGLRWHDLRQYDTPRLVRTAQLTNGQTR